MIGDRWNVTDDEMARHYPCDDIVTSPTLQAWRGVTVHTSRAGLWPWVSQIRLAPYSYDWIDNLGRTSPRDLVPMPEPVVGEHFTTAATRPCGTILAVTPGVSLTGRILGAVMSYDLVTVDEHTTRLLLKVVMSGGGVARPVISLGDLVMARRQLLNFKHLAEESAPGR
ncbi:hypothetical protein GCM10009619_43000 [Williamsia maris]|uniref:Polyketide cyclase n=1 Tax=Williamsia maris TaxID=72806 RepID=A0ABT1HJS4_9NOCA|nr:hypothetical protein [Williamsia maris]